MSNIKLYAAMKAGMKLESIPTESFFPQMKYASKHALPPKLIYQKRRGKVGLPATAELAN